MLIKAQITNYLNGTKSNDVFEIKSHCKKLIKNVIIPRKSTSQLHNWLHQQLHPKCQQQNPDVPYPNAIKNKSKWKRNKMQQ